MNRKKPENDNDGCTFTFDETARVKKWTLVSGEKLISSGPFTIQRQMFTSPRTGSDYPFITASGSDWVSVVALTNASEIILVEQYRHGRDIITFELPGGLIDAGEKSSDAAIRELGEETGYSGKTPVLLGKLEPNPAFLNVTCHCYFIDDAEKTMETNLDASEDIVVHRIPLSSIRSLIASGVIRHGLAIAGLTLFACQKGDVRFSS